MRLKPINLGQIQNPHGYANVAAGQSKTILYIKVPSGMVLFINRIANNYFNDTYWEFIIDGERVFPKIEREIAPINQPEEYDPPFLCTGHVKWIFYNNSVEDITAEVLCDGNLYRYR